MYHSLAYRSILRSLLSIMWTAIYHKWMSLTWDLLIFPCMFKQPEFINIIIGEMRLVPDHLILLDQQADVLLSDINLYSCLLSVKLQRLYTGANLSVEASKHCLRAQRIMKYDLCSFLKFLKRYLSLNKIKCLHFRRYLQPNQSLRLSQTKSAGILLTDNEATAEQGIALLIEVQFSWYITFTCRRNAFSRLLVIFIQKRFMNKSERK